MLCLVCAGVQGAGEEASAGERGRWIVWLLLDKARPKCSKVRECFSKSPCPNQGLHRSVMEALGLERV